MISVVETVNGVGLSCAGSGTWDSVYAPQLSRETCMVKDGIHNLAVTTFCVAFFSTSGSLRFQRD